MPAKPTSQNACDWLRTSTARFELAQFYRETLFDDVLRFWTENAIDREHGGFVTAVHRDGSWLDDDKALWQQARFTWLLGELHNNVDHNNVDHSNVDQGNVDQGNVDQGNVDQGNVDQGVNRHTTQTEVNQADWDDAPSDQPDGGMGKKEAGWIELAGHGIEFMEQYGFDPRDGRMWFQVTRDGRPLRKRRYAFTESFAALAYGEYAQATGQAEYADQAAIRFDRFVHHRVDPVSAKFTETRPTRSLGIPMITINTAQQLRDSIELAGADDWIDQSIETIQRYHLDQGHRCVLETVGLNGEFIDHFDGRTLNPGHAIEAAWFILDEARRRDDSALVQLGCQILDWSWERGWDPEYGGLLYFVDARGWPVQEYWHDMKFWWPHNEAITATLLAFLLTGEPKYADWHHAVHHWAFDRFADLEYGEWFGYLHRDGRLSVSLKGNMWKGPFHLPRMLLTCWQLLSRMG